MATGTYNIYVDSYVLILACSFVLAGSLQIRYLLSYAVSTKTGPFFPERMSSRVWSNKWGSPFSFSHGQFMRKVIFRSIEN